MGVWPRSRRLLRWLQRVGLRAPARHSPVSRSRGAREHVIILDGTLSSLEPGRESNAGLTYKLLREAGVASLYYEAGPQWRDWSDTNKVLTGRGISQQICRAYSFLASRYRPGDRIYLLGFSRGAFAVRSLAGMIDVIGLLQAEHATERNIRQSYRLYRHNAHGAVAQAFRSAHCHARIEIEVVGVWDTVKALGLKLPLLSGYRDAEHRYHNHRLGAATRHGYHALAYDETRVAFAPVLWRCDPGFAGHVEQVWFRGNHADIGGQLRGYDAARPLANIPFVWMLERLQAHGLPMPAHWDQRFPRDPAAPSTGAWRGWRKLFWLRARRVVGEDPSERLHHSLRGALPSPKVATRG